MKKILIIVDKPNSAIDILAQGIKKHNPHFDIRVQALHPKRPSIDQAEVIPVLLKWADLVDVQYWKSGVKARELWPDLFARAKKILTHHNPYDLHKEQWVEYKKVVVTNKYQQTSLPMAIKIPLSIDLEYYTYHPELTEAKVVNMCVARIEGKKGVKEVAQACRELGYKFKLIGRVSNGAYMDEVLEAGGDSIEFRENVTDDVKLEIYRNSGLHVCNSIDNFETGTLPIMESMACGVPVLTRDVGHVPDLYDGKNMLIRYGAPDDVEGLKRDIEDIMENYDRRLKVRRYAWDTIKNYGHRRMAREYSKLYYSIDENPLVSIITPTYDRPESLIKSMAHSINQTYSNVELVVVDSGKESMEPIIEKFRVESAIPIKYIRFQSKGYTLAEARNRGAIEAQGEVLVFCDDRLGMDNNTAEVFSNVMSKNWWWGTKDGNMKGFVENFSAVKRKDFIASGMFCERMEQYGGMTQEIRTRLEKQDFQFIGVDGVDAKEIHRARGMDGRRADIIESKFLLYKMYG